MAVVVFGIAALLGAVAAALVIAPVGVVPALLAAPVGGSLLALISAIAVAVRMRSLPVVQPRKLPTLRRRLPAAGSVRGRHVPESRQPIPASVVWC
jgi:hypothetical protein